MRCGLGEIVKTKHGGSASVFGTGEGIRGSPVLLAGDATIRGNP
jgi:hypothetical protein